MAKDNLNIKDGFLSVEDISKMEIAFREKYMFFFNEDEDIAFEGHVLNDYLYLTLVFKNFDESFYYPFQTCVELSKELNKEKAQDLLLDFIDSYFNDYFNKDRNIFIKIDWEKYKYRGFELLAKGQVLNKKLESMADNFLNQKGYSSSGENIKDNNENKVE